MRVQSTSQHFRARMRTARLDLLLGSTCVGISQFPYIPINTTRIPINAPKFTPCACVNVNARPVYSNCSKLGSIIPWVKGPVKRRESKGITRTMDYTISDRWTGNARAALTLTYGRDVISTTPSSLRFHASNYGGAETVIASLAPRSQPFQPH